MARLYHLLPDDLRGDALHPLNRLKDLHPDAHAWHMRKYRGREVLLERRVPGLDCLWNDVLHLSPVHPALIRDAKRGLGLGWPEGGRAVAVIDPERHGLTPDDTMVWLSPAREEGDLRASAEDFAPYSPSFVEANAHLPERTLAHYRSAKANGHPTFLFVGVPHILHRGAIDLREVEVIRV